MSKITTNHQKIRDWAEERGGVPAIVNNAENGEGILLRIDFGEKDGYLEVITWEEFFEFFEDNNLAFLYMEKTAQGGTSRFYKIIERLGSEESEDMEYKQGEEDSDEEE